MPAMGKNQACIVPIAFPRAWGNVRGFGGMRIVKKIDKNQSVAGLGIATTACSISHK
jgi:hypothetical protein